MAHTMDEIRFHSIPTDGFANRRRATRACYSCRVRKVRCDATRRETPCTNCRLSNTSCLLTESSRQRHRPVVARNSIPTASTTSTASTMSDAEYLISLSFDELGNNSSVDNECTVQQDVDIGSPPAVFFDRCARPAPKLSQHGLPSYIRALPSHLTQTSIDELTNQGALTLPEDDLQHELFRKYILYVHAFMPVINLAAFFSPISRRDETGSVSLLLFQAVMFASAAYVDPEYSTERGYQGRKSLRRTFFKRARLLYDLDCETDRFAVLQALLLLTCWYEKSEEDEEEAWQLMGVALSLAKSLDIHCDPKHLTVSSDMKHLRKKVWWSCFVRDRLLSLGMGRPARIHPGDFDVPMLTMEDCEMKPLEDDILFWVGPVPVADDCPTKASIYLCFVELVQLCVRLGDSLLHRFSILSNPASVMAQVISMMVQPNSEGAQVQDAQPCDAELRGWQQSLTPGCRYTKGQLQNHVTRNESHRLLRLYQALLHVVYLTATAVVHQSQMLRATGNEELNNGFGLMRLSRSKVSRAAADITDLVLELSDDDQLRFAPTITIPALISATLTHLIDIRSPSNAIRYISIGRFFQCWQALHSLKEMYASADHAVSFLETVIANAGVRIPMLTMPSISRSLGTVAVSTERFMQHSSTGRHIKSVDRDIVDQAVDYIMASSGSGSAATYTGSRSLARQGGHCSLQLQTESQPEEAEARVMADDVGRHEDTCNGMEIGEDLQETLALFNTQTSFSLTC